MADDGKVLPPTPIEVLVALGDAAGIPVYISGEVEKGPINNVALKLGQPDRGRTEGPGDDE